MAYLIDRNKLYNHIKTEINPYGKPFKGSAYEFGVKLMDDLLDMEVVDAMPVVHGHWDYKNYTWHCSVCDYHPYKGYIPAKADYKYCPECGAKMDEPVYACSMPYEFCSDFPHENTRNCDCGERE